MTGLRRINGHVHAGVQGPHVPANGFDNTRELMSENQRRFKDSGANATVEIRMEIAPADAGCRDTDQDFSRVWLAGVGDVFNADVTRTVEPGRKHGRSRP